MASLFSIIQAVGVRCLLVTHAIVCIWYVTYRLGRTIFWLLMCLLVPLMIESGYTIIIRQGRDFARFTPCFFFYLVPVLPGIWLLELDRTEMVKNGRDMQDNSYDPNDIRIPGATQNVWLIVIEELMPYVIFISRWLLPRGTVSRKELAELLICFIEIGTDIMEFFSLIGENIIRGDMSLVSAVLALWTFAVLQFTMTITVVHGTKRKKFERGVVAESTEGKKWQETKGEIYSIFLSIIMQDLPFVVMRLYLIIRFNLIDYSLIFFTCKNLLKIVLLLYKAAVCFIQYKSPDSEGEEHGHKVKGITNFGGGRNTGNGNIRNNSFAGSLNLFNFNGEKADLSSTQTHYIGDSESAVKKRNGNSKLQNHTLNDKYVISGESMDTLFHQYELPLPISNTPISRFRPNGFGYFSKPDVKLRKSYEKSVYKNNKKSSNISNEYKSSDTEMTYNHLQFPQSNTNSLFHVASQRYGMYSHPGYTIPPPVGVRPHNYIPINPQESRLHPILYLDRKNRHKNRHKANPYPTPVMSLEEVFGQIPIYPNPSLYAYGTEAPMMFLPDSESGWNWQGPITDYDIYFSDHMSW